MTEEYLNQLLLRRLAAAQTPIGTVLALFALSATKASG